jgi:NAD(P)-dependent dehydrogenase (short-subunit alcohol dehydrogenase family)
MDIFRCYLDLRPTRVFAAAKSSEVLRWGTMTKRVVLVTGASSGIGQACARSLAGRGFCVYGTSRHTVLEASGVSPIAEGSVRMLAVDVGEDQSVAQGVETILSREGRLDIVVNNAGMAIAGSVEDTSIEEAKRQLEVNFFGAFRVCRAALPPMRQQGGGYIVNISSIGGLIAIPYQAMYSASKFALEGLSEALRLEVGRMGIRVVLIEPGDHKTLLTQNRQRTERSVKDETYRQPFSSALGRTMEDEQSGPGPEAIARLLLEIVNVRHPRLRYTVGPAPQRAAAWLKRLLPYEAIERGMRLYYGL